jgi:hypothetical protein
MNSFVVNNRRYNASCPSIRTLGKGSFGTVYRIPISGHEVAVKVLDLRKKNEKNLFVFVL